MCQELHGVPPLLPREQRGPADRIDPSELTSLGGLSRGWVALPPAGTSASVNPPVLVLCHERYGLVQHTLGLAERFAAEGFVVIAPDFYADVHLTGTEERLPGIPDDAVLRHIDRAVAHARSLEDVATDSPLVVMGVCMTGSFGVVASATRADVDAVVMLYGGAQDKEFRSDESRNAPYEELLRKGRAPILGLWGEADHTMSLGHVRRIRDILESAMRSYEFHIYAGMPHGWLNDTMPGRFRAEEARRTFDLIVSWLRATLHPSTRPAPGTVTWEFTCSTTEDYDFASMTRQV